MNLSSLLTRYPSKTLFLPAHGRGKALPLEIRKLLKRSPGIWDLPELPDIGTPLEELGAVGRSQNISASDFGADRGWYGVNGATGLLQAALLAMAKPGKYILMPRNIHRSLIYGCVLGGLKPVFFDLPFLSDRGHHLPPDEIWMDNVMDEIDRKSIEISGIVLVNPTYQGYSSHLKSLIRKFHVKGWPVLIDEAHGTHFCLGAEIGLPTSALNSGADLVVNSLHKSSVGLSQTAVLWIQGNIVDPLRVSRTLGLLQTSSTNALLLASCEAALREFNKPARLKSLKRRINEGRKMADELLGMGVPLLRNEDPLKLVLHTASKGINGLVADEWFSARKLIAELPEPGSLTFCLGFVRHSGLGRLIKRRWNNLTEEYSGRKEPLNFSKPRLPLVSLLNIDCSEAWNSDFDVVPIAEAIGRVSADLICPYPPGIPILFPGECLNKDKIEWLIQQKKMWGNEIPSDLRVLV